MGLFGAQKVKKFTWDIYGQNIYEKYKKQLEKELKKMIQLLHKSKHDMGELKRTWDLISNDKTATKPQ